MNILLTVLLPLVTEGPDPEDVKAGWVAFAIFLAMAAAVAFLGFSLHKQLKKVDFEEEPTKKAGEGDSRPTS